MAKGFFRELKHYTVYSISEELGENIDETKRLVGILKKYGVVKAVKKSKPEFDDLSNQDIVLADVSESISDVEYVFDYVGVILLGGHVFKCYPKYISSSAEPIQELKQVLRVIKKYNSNEQLIYLYNGQDDRKIFNRLAISLYLLEEYFMYGIYTNQHERIETNGEGEILWNRTINETFALIQNNRPYYVELQTQNIADNDMDFFKRLHECILTKCTLELKDTGVLELFDISEVHITNLTLEDLGDVDYILYRLENEIQNQYVTRKQNLLKTIYTYIAKDKLNKEDIDFSLYGTNSFNLVWEKVCSDNFGSVLNEKIEKLPLGVAEEYKDRRNSKLIDIIDRPIWHGNKPEIYDDKVETLRPDLICIYPCNEDKDYCFGIYDAKYYCIDFKEQKSGWKVTGQPSVGDVTKQYLYQLAYKDFATKQGYKYVQNMFFCPKEEKGKEYGYVEMKMLHNLVENQLENILVVKLCASEMFDLYLSNKQVDNIVKYIPQVNTKNVISKKFTNKMIEYLKRITQSRKVEVNLDVLPNREQLIYPEKIKREIGAKLIYDVICSVAGRVIYGFNPYITDEKMVAEDIGNIDARCIEIATAAMDIEKEIKDHTDQELKDEIVVKAILKQGLQEKEKINSLMIEKNLDNLKERIMELIRNLYL